jgi:hypothetical protein
MQLTRNLTAFLLFAAACGYATPARACPLCKEAAESAIDSSSDQDFDDPAAEARAYNRSIYMMIGIPYAFFAVGGFYCYRHLKGRGVAVTEGDAPQS